MKAIKLVCEDNLRKDLIGIPVKPDSSDEKWFMKKIVPKLKDGIVTHLGVLFGEEDNTYFITPEDFERVKILIDKRKSKKEIVMFTSELVGGVVGAIAMYYICDAIKNHF